METRGAVFIESERSKVKLMKSWEQTFTSDLSTEEKKRIFFDQFLWHAFSYKVIEAKEKNQGKTSV